MIFDLKGLQSHMGPPFASLTTHSRFAPVRPHMLRFFFKIYFKKLEKFNMGRGPRSPFVPQTCGLGFLFLSKKKILKSKEKAPSLPVPDLRSGFF